MDNQVEPQRDRFPCLDPKCPVPVGHYHDGLAAGNGTPPSVPQRMADLPHLMLSLSHMPSDERVPQVLRDGAREFERLLGFVQRIRDARTGHQKTALACWALDGTSLEEADYWS